MATRILPSDSTIIYDRPLDDEGPELPVIVARYSDGASFISSGAEVYVPFRMIPDIIKTLNKIYKENKNGTNGTI